MCEKVADLFSEGESDLGLVSEEVKALFFSYHVQNSSSSGGGGEGEHVTLNTQQYTVLRIDSKVRTEEARVSNATHTQQYTV